MERGVGLVGGGGSPPLAVEEGLFSFLGQP